MLAVDHDHEVCITLYGQTSTRTVTNVSSLYYTCVRSGAIYTLIDCDMNAPESPDRGPICQLKLTMIKYIEVNNYQH